MLLIVQKGRASLLQPHVYQQVSTPWKLNSLSHFNRDLDRVPLHPFQSLADHLDSKHV